LRASVLPIVAYHRSFPAMNEQKLPRPSQNYKALQQQLAEAIARKPNTDWNEIHHLRPLLIKEFEEAFNFKISNQHSGGRKRQTLQLLRAGLRILGHSWPDFDHVDHAERPRFEGEILISQPYGVATEVHERLAANFGYTFTQADEWTYY
jgi:hypothetical protein